MQRFSKRDQINGLLIFAESNHLVEYAAMLFQEKIFCLEIFNGCVEGVIVQKNSPENGAFSVKILWQRAFESGFSRHRESFCIRLLFAL